jgi:DNA (cytosine-5)-methyltransferase 1
MFSGVGGFELAMPQHECVGVSEIDKYSCELLLNKFKGVKNYGDATKINAKELPEFDMLCGGFPCQAFSIAGKRKGFKDTRGTLFFDVARIVKTKRPKIVFLENVKGLLNHEKGKTFRTIIQTLSELGYDVQWLVCNSKFFGVPQNRERVFIIGSLRGKSRPEILPLGKGNGTGVEIKQLNNPIHSNNRVYSEKGLSPSLNTAQGGNRQPFIQSHSPRTNDPKKGGSGPLRSEKHCFTLDRSPHYLIKDMKIANSVTPDAYLTSGKRKRVNGKAVLTSMHERRIRRLTPLECERLQGFPEGWTEGFSDMQRYKMMGNAVTVNVIKAIGRKL